MADKADEMLARARQARDIWKGTRSGSENERDASDELVRWFGGLDRLLSSGAPLPSAWERRDDPVVREMLSRLPPRLSAAQRHVRGDFRDEYEDAGWLRTRLAEKDAEIRRLTAELDDARHVPAVEYATSPAALEAAMTADPGRENGVVLRETYGQKREFAWRKGRQQWEQTR
jgi:hypothetical protein